jgi:hypothetical protein
MKRREDESQMKSWLVTSYHVIERDRQAPLQRPALWSLADYGSRPIDAAAGEQRRRFRSDCKDSHVRTRHRVPEA